MEPPKNNRKPQNPMATSVQMARLLQNTFMNTASVGHKEQERQNFLDSMFARHQPTFKNYIQNNTQMLRTTQNQQRVAKFNETEAFEREY